MVSLRLRRKRPFTTESTETTEASWLPAQLLEDGHGRDAARQLAHRFVRVLVRFPEHRHVLLGRAVDDGDAVDGLVGIGRDALLPALGGEAEGDEARRHGGLARGAA